MRARSTHIGTIPKDSLERFKALHWGVHSCTRESVWLRRYHSAVIFANFLVFATVPMNDIFLFPSKVRILIMKTVIFILIIGDVLCRRYEDEQYSCYENEHMSNMGIFGDPYCCDTDLTVASFFEQLTMDQKSEPMDPKSEKFNVKWSLTSESIWLFCSSNDAIFICWNASAWNDYWIKLSSLAAKNFSSKCLPQHQHWFWQKFVAFRKMYVHRRSRFKLEYLYQSFIMSHNL